MRRLAKLDCDVLRVAELFHTVCFDIASRFSSARMQDNSDNVRVPGLWCLCRTTSGTGSRLFRLTEKCTEDFLLCFLALMCTCEIHFHFAHAPKQVSPRDLFWSIIYLCSQNHDSKS